MLSQSCSVLTTLRHDVTGQAFSNHNDEFGLLFHCLPYSLQLVGIKLSRCYKIVLLNLIMVSTFHHE